MDKDILERILKIQEKEGMTQGEFAYQMGMKQGTWSAIERGKSPLSNRYIQLICSTYSISENWLIEGKGEMYLVDFNEKETRLVSVFRKLTESFKDTALTIINGLYEQQKKEGVSERSAERKLD